MKHALFYEFILYLFDIYFINFINLFKTHVFFFSNT